MLWTCLGGGPRILVISNYGTGKLIRKVKVMDEEPLPGNDDEKLNVSTNEIGPVMFNCFIRFIPEKLFLDTVEVTLTSIIRVY